MSARRTKEALALMQLCEDQGFRVRKTKAGFQILAKTGTGMVVIHMTCSDVRALKNVRSELKKIGVEL